MLASSTEIPRHSTSFPARPPARPPEWPPHALANLANNGSATNGSTVTASATNTGSATNSSALAAQAVPSPQTIATNVRRLMARDGLTFGDVVSARPKIGSGAS